MKDITNEFGRFYYPKSLMVFYKRKGRINESFVEFFDIDKDGNPINAHPLTVNEAKQLATALDTEKENKEAFLIPQGILDSSILYTNSQEEKAVWFTKAQHRELYFTEILGIPNGIAHLPPLLWVADRQHLKIFALGSNRRPTNSTKLYNAPFFNVDEDGKVCMGTVDINIDGVASLEEFMNVWEAYFFNSYFSHLMDGHNPIDGNCVLLWENLVSSEEQFPKSVLTTTGLTIKDLL